MTHRLIANAFVLLCAGWLVTGVAFAQRSARASINRASTGSASQVLGRVGGTNTGRYGNPQGIINNATGTVNPVQAAFNQRSFFGAAGGLGQLPYAPLPQAFMLVPQQITSARLPSPWAAVINGVQDTQLASASRLTASQRLTVPLNGLASSAVRIPAQSFYITAPAGNAYDDFFGLTPVDTSPARQPTPDENWLSLLERQNAEQALLKTRQALAKFKTATQAQVERRYDVLAEAQSALRLARDLDSQAYIPSLLLLHLALEKNQVLAAIAQLETAVARNPSLFVDKVDLRPYFGDPMVLENTSRARLRIGDLHSSPSAYALQAYCAWVLGDQMRISEALARMNEYDLSGEKEKSINAVRQALLAATQ